MSVLYVVTMAVVALCFYLMGHEIGRRQNRYQLWKRWCSCGSMAVDLSRCPDEGHVVHGADVCQPLREWISE